MGEPTKKLTPSQWEKVRDGLADLWDWWGEGVPLRSQPSYDENGKLVFIPPMVVKLAENDRILSHSAVDEGQTPRPTRVVTVDAHLGDALFQLCCDTHRTIANVKRLDRESGLLHPVDWNRVAPCDAIRRYQVMDEQMELVLFSPAGYPNDYFRLYFNRIDSAGYRWRGSFPASIDLSLIDLCRVDLSYLKLPGLLLCEAGLVGARLQGADLYGANLTGAQLDNAILNGTIVEKGALATAMNAPQGAIEISGRVSI